MFFFDATARRSTSRLGAYVVTIPVTSLSGYPVWKMPADELFHDDPICCCMRSTMC
jgi:hypothetical protein